jgi:hypothetical protein
LSIRSSSILMLERLREKSQLRKEVLIFLMKFKYYFFRLLPKEDKVVPKNASSASASASEKRMDRDRDLDSEFTACLSFYFYQCMHDEDVELRILAMKCWGEVFRSELAQYANELLVVQVNNFVSEVSIQMKIDLWKYDRGGMYLLENLAWSAGSMNGDQGEGLAPEVRSEVESLQNDEAYLAFSRWLDDLSEDIRDAFEVQISNTADRMRQEVVAIRSKAVRNRKEKWEIFSMQRSGHSQELYEYIYQLFAVKKREARAIQREQIKTMKARIGQWVNESSYSFYIAKSHFDHSDRFANSGSLIKSLLQKHTFITNLPPALFSGPYIPSTHWRKVVSDSAPSSECIVAMTATATAPLYVESVEVPIASGEWALELTERTSRMRRKIRFVRCVFFFFWRVMFLRRGNLALVPIYLTTGETTE